MRTSLVAAALLLSAVFAFDWFVPSGYNVPLLYVAVVLLTMERAVSRRITWLVTSLATILTIALSLKRGDVQAGLFNRSLSLFVLWVTAVGINVRKRTESLLREQESLAQLGKVAAVVAHEVRNPLAGIRGALHIFEKRFPLEAPEHAVIQEVVARIGYLAAMVENLVVFAQPLPPSLRPVRLDEVVGSTLNLLQYDPLFGKVTITTDAPGITINADPDQLRMALTNILINGAQAMDGCGQLRISARIVGDWHELRVTDAGPGIAPEARARLFEPFFTTKHRGTGLGLAIARRILSAHGGTIEIDSAVGQGTTMIVKLPGLGTKTRKL